MIFLLYSACTGGESDATQLWITDVVVTPSGSVEQPLSANVYPEDTDVDPKCGDAAQSKCISWETMNPLTGGTVVADQDVTVGADVIAAGDDLADAVFGDTFPREIYAYDEHFVEFAADVSIADATTFTFAWSDEDGAAHGDTLGYSGGALTD
ncbi:MAG: hypothetical protein ACOZNI_19000 [Myxococcota bacterium]